MANKRKKREYSTNAVEILHRELFESNLKAQAALEGGRVHAQIAKIIYDLRTEAGLTQKELAAFAGTSHSQISRIEDADYDGHSISTLIRIASVFEGRIQIKVKPMRPQRRFLYAPITGKRIAVPKAIA